MLAPIGALHAADGPRQNPNIVFILVDEDALGGNEHPRPPLEVYRETIRLAINQSRSKPSPHPGPTPAASSSAPVLGVGQGIESAFVSLNLIYPIRCPADRVHFKFRRVSLTSPVSESTPSAEPDRWFSSEVYPHDDQLKAYLRGRFPDERDVEDVVQESYVRIWKARVATPIKSVKAFLFRVARNVALDRHRRTRGDLETDLDNRSVQNVIDEAADVAETISSLEKERLLADALAILPSRAHEVVILCKINGLSHCEAARQLGISARTVDEHLRRGMKRLGEELRKRGLHRLYE